MINSIWFHSCCSGYSFVGQIYWSLVGKVKGRRVDWTGGFPLLPPALRAWSLSLLCVSFLRLKMTSAHWQESARLGRYEKIKDHKFGSKDHSQEELVAVLLSYVLTR